MAYFGQSYFKARYFKQGFLAGVGEIVTAVQDYLVTIARRMSRR